VAQTIHLVRHGEVENPKGVIYGRLPGYHLSERGRRQARAAAAHLRDADIGSLWSSPLERAQETAQAIADGRGIEIHTDDRLIESSNLLEGVGKTIWAVVSNPAHWWRLRNPFTPSWGESFRDIAARMVPAIHEAAAAAASRAVVIVSHQTPVLVARHSLARRRVPPWLGFVPCQTGSVTTLVLEEGRVLEASYFAPRERSEAQD
jgi:broad specificity phosphatase PhoE